MRKLAFYPKLALSNLWRNKTTYLPYLLACTVSIFTFYTLLAINNNGALLELPQTAVVLTFTFIGIIILAIFCAVLLFYTNSFLIKRRKKEIGLYSILGMEKRNIGVLLFFETLFIALLAMLLGIVLGLLFSRLVYMTLLRLVRFPVSIEMPISSSAIWTTVIYFAVIFGLTLLTNLRQVRIANPVEMLSGSKEGEKEPRASWVLTLVGVLTLGGGYFIALYFTGAAESLMLFLVAAFLVIIGTFCLFTSGSVAILKLMRKNKNFYYTPKHFISVSGMIYRMKQNAAGLAAICVLSCMVLVTLSSTISLNVGAEDSMDTMFPNDYEMRFKNTEDGDTLLAGARQVAEESDVALINLRDYETASVWARSRGEDAYEVIPWQEAAENDGDFAFLELMSLEEYNKSEDENRVLQPGKALFFYSGIRYKKDEMTLNGTTYALEYLDTFGSQSAGQTNVGKSFMLVLPTRQEQEKLIAQGGIPIADVMKREINFDVEGDEESRQLFEEDFGEFVGMLHTQETFDYESKEEMREFWYATNGGFLFLGVYFGILFLLAAVMIIYYKQVSEGYDDADRFEILQKVGMSEQEVKDTINAQIRTVFFLPLVIAVLHIVVAFWPVSRVLRTFGVMNRPLMALCTLLTVLVYAFIYLLVYRRTARTYFKIVKRKAV